MRDRFARDQFDHRPSSRSLYSFRLVEFMLGTGLAILAVRRAGRSESIKCVEHLPIFRAATWAALASDILGPLARAVVGTKEQQP